MSILKTRALIKHYLVRVIWTLIGQPVMIYAWV
ncbi:unnamed protein product, partial [Vitis vinifera]|uniref:Uncharacterized protein n=1 Tax=Vitis vinifera TaxID=29760 RepID=D7STA8_VITVI